MADKRKQTIAEAGADLWDALYRLRDDLLGPFVPMAQALARLLCGSSRDLAVGQIDKAIDNAERKSRAMTNFEYYYPLLKSDKRYSAHHYGICVETGFKELRRVCEFDTREELIEWYCSEYTGKTLDPM